MYNIFHLLQTFRDFLMSFVMYYIGEILGSDWLYPGPWPDPKDVYLY